MDRWRQPSLHTLYKYEASSVYLLAPPMQPPMLQRTAPTQPVMSSHTLPQAGPSTAPRYQEASGSAVRTSSRRVPAPTPAPSKPTSTAAMVGATSQGSSSQGAQESAHLGKEWLPKAKRVGPATRATVWSTREKGAQWVLKDYKAITAALEDKDRTEVSLEGNDYITTWEMYDNVVNYFMRCEEKGCRYSRHIYSGSPDFRTHLRKHAMDKVVREVGETDESFQARKKAAGEA